MATSLFAIRGDPLDAATSPRLLAAILDHFSSVLGATGRDPTPPWSARWKALDLLRDAWVTVDLGNRIAAGRGRGIDEDGALCLDQGGTILRLLGGRVLR